jgi:hypothetical protein
MLVSYDKGKKKDDQQNSLFSHPKNIDSDLPLANLKSGSIGTVYSGTESLAGYGKLSFTLEPGTQAIMNDAKTTIVGTYFREGNRIVISFPDVGATYTGVINGKQITGNAVNTKGQKWSFSVNRTN